MPADLEQHPLEQLPAAIRHLLDGHAQGKVVVEV
jgi:NADPH-dependent curcumin reductase CurA